MAASTHRAQARSYKAPETWAYAALRLGFSMVPMHLGEPQWQAQIFFRRAV
jgi:hypothetical protein